MTRARAIGATTAAAATGRRPLRGAVLGGDVSRSLSPAIHTAAFRALGLRGRYDAHSVDGRAFSAEARRLIGGGADYLNVTIPHKALARRLAGNATPLVRRCGAANMLIARPHGRLVAHNTDGEGLLRALTDLGREVAPGSRLVLVGAGGAAAGVLEPLLARGARVTLLARRAAAAVSLRRRVPRRQRARLVAARLDAATLSRALADADVLISAVPADAWGDPSLARAVAGAPRSVAVSEMAYATAPTPLARAARPRLRYQDGVPMLVHQAACAVALIVGRAPPARPLLRAARRAQRRLAARP